MNRAKLRSKIQIMHKPVLLKEVIKYLNPKIGDNIIDATFGFGGHSKEILKKIAPNGKVLGIEKDKYVIEQSREQGSERLILVNDSYINLKKIVEQNNFKKVNGILFDLGVSSWHFESSGRGFSFQKTSH